MAVTRVRERWQGADGSFNYTFIPSDTLKRYFLVYTDSLSDSAATVFLSGDLPSLGSSHPDSNILTVRTLDIAREPKSPFLYNVTANYGDAPIKPPQDANPLTRQAVITGTVAQYSRSTITDCNGDAELNTVGDPFDPHDIDDVRFSWQIEKNVPYNAVPSWTLTLPNCTNSDSFTIAQLGLTFDANTIKLSDHKMSDIKTEFVENLNAYVSYRTLAWTVAFNKDTWKFKTPNRGYRAIKQSGSSGVATTISVGNPYDIVFEGQKGVNVKPSKPVFLSSDSQPLTNPDASDLYILEFDDYNSDDFSVLTPYTV